MIDNKVMVGFCCTTIHKEPVRPVLDNLVNEFEVSEDYRLVVYQCFEDLYIDTPNARGAASVFNMINYDMLDVMIFMQFNEQQKPLFTKIAKRCRKHNIPVIYIDEFIDDAFCVSFGYGDAFSRIVEHVITVHGCKNIKHVAGIKGNDFSQTRIDSCREVMARHGLTLKDKDILYGCFWDVPTYEAMDEFFASGEPLPDAFICANDSMAMAVCQKLNEKGYHIPDDVIVTGFDGIESEKYHSPRITNATRDNAELASAVMRLIKEVSANPQQKPYNVELSYTPVFTESCNCCKNDPAKRSKSLAGYVRNYAYARGFEERMNDMANLISAKPNIEYAREIFRKYCFWGTHICVTDEYHRYFSEDINEEDKEALPEDYYPEKMHLLVDCTDNPTAEGTTFSTSEILPDLMDHFDGKHTIVVVSLHSQEKILGYYTINYLSDDLCKDQMYTFTMMANHCLENIRIHEHMSFLNKKLEFMFTHDHLTKIFNRYGFYKNFREDFAQLETECKDVFIVSIDLNDMKTINDTYGHHAGDEALRITANALTGAAEVGDSDIICSRFGGDEFVVAKICKGDAKEQAERYRRNFDSVLAGLNSTSGNKFTVAVSIGVYCASLNEVDTIDELIELADRLMYNDKARHKRRPKNL